MIALLTSLADQRSREMRDYAASRRRTTEARRQAPPRAPSAAAGERLSIRPLDAAGSDRRALQRLADRDSAAVPGGEALGVERRGRLIAAVSLSTGEVVADPFVPTAAARSLLEHRALHLSGGRARRVIARAGDRAERTRAQRLLRPWRRARSA